jgi:hypothetical protein
MITFYKDRNLTIPKPSIENSYVRINIKRFNISRRAISETTFRGISPETITLNLTKYKYKLYGFIKFYSRAKIVFKLFIYYYKFKKTVCRF